MKISELFRPAFLLLSLLLSLPVSTLHGLELFTDTLPPSQSEKKEPAISGRPIFTIFANYKHGFETAESQSGFNLDRAYLGYEVFFPKGFSAELLFDMGDPNIDGSGLQRIAFIKHALISYTFKGFNIKAGLMDLNQSAYQLKQWGYRYVYRSAQDYYKFGHTADMGIMLSYRFNSLVSIDAAISNGEGFKKLNRDDSYRYGVGLLITPVKGLSLRFYYDISNKLITQEACQQTFASFIGYKHRYFSIGAEYNRQWNSNFNLGKDQDLISFYATGHVHRQVAVFARYDQLFTKNHWGKDEFAVIAGIDYHPIRQISISPNFIFQRNLAKENAIYVALSARLSL